MNRRPKVSSRALPLLAIVASACRPVGPDYALPREALVNAPAAKGAFVEGASPAFVQEEPAEGWWRLYRDARLDGLVERALSANTDVRVAEANLESSRASLDAAKAAREPDVALNLGSAYNQRSAEAYLHAGPVPAGLLYDIGLGVSYDLDLFGKLRRGIEAASAESEALAAVRDLVRVNVAAETVRAYAEVCDASHELDAARGVLALQRQAALLVQRTAEGGRTIHLEVVRQQGLIEQLDASVPPIDARRINALLRLATLTGRPPAAMEPFECRGPLRLDQPLPIGDGAALLKRRPDVRAAERRLAASTAIVGVATAALYPSVQLGASLGSTGAVKDFGTARTDRYSVGGGVTWHANQSVARAKIAQADSEAKAALARFDGAVLTALRDVETALDRYVHDLERRASLERARDRAEEAASDARTLFENGRSGALALLDVQRTFAAAEQSFAAAETQVSLDQVAVFLALGGGWSVASPAPAAPRPASSGK